MTKQINLDPTTKHRPVKASWRDRSVALAAIITVLLIFAIVGGGALWLILKIWTSILSMM